MNKHVKAKFKYDYDTDSYSIVPLNREYDSSLQIGDLIFDLDKDNSLTGIEVLNVSRLFRIPKAFLKSQVSGRVDVEISEEYIRLLFTIKSVVRNSDKTSTLSLERIKPDFLKPIEINFAVA